MLPTAFLSLSGTDDAFVERVHSLLPDALAHFYPQTFANGENLLDAMEERVGQSSIFALFASQASLKSVWVKFEINRARLNKIKHPDTRILVFIIDAKVEHSDLPDWMREFWVPNANQNARDVARYIRNLLVEAAVTGSPLSSPIGRGSFTDDAISAIQSRFLIEKEMPNIFIFSGHTGIGRQTVLRKFLKEGFPALKNLSFGPQFQLPQFADSADLYRAFRQEIDVNFTIASYEADLLAFNKLPEEARAAELAECVEHFGKMGQAVTVVTGNGIYEDSGVVKGWVSSLFKALANKNRAKLCFVTNRLLHPNELNPHSNVLQFMVPPLSDQHISTLIIATSQAMGFDPQLPNERVIRAIGGHAGIARTTAGLIAHAGVMAVNDNLGDLFRVQDEVLKDSLSFDMLDAVERDCLSILSWVPVLDGQVLRDIILERHKLTREKFADKISKLVSVCLVLSSGANYSISGPIRGMFRRLHGYGSPELRTAFANKLSGEWKARRSQDAFPVDIFDALVYMIALEGGSLPPELAKLLLPSTLQEVVKDTYDTGHEDDDALRRVITWGLPAREMKMDETTREEILSYVVRAQSRLQDREGAKRMLEFFDSKGYRSRHYMRAFNIRLCGGDLKEVIDLLRKAKDVRKYRRRVIADLASSYQKLGMWKELAALIRDEGEDTDNAVLLDLTVGMLIAQSEFRRAADAIGKLRSNGWNDGRAERRHATLIMKRDKDYKAAKAQLTELLDNKTRGHLSVRMSRAIAAAEDGDYATAQTDADFFRLRKDGHDAALRIEARIYNHRREYDVAEGKLDGIKVPWGPDHLLRAHVLDHRASDIRTPLAARAELTERARGLRTLYPTADEFSWD